MFCTNCGKKVPDNINFCPSCGTKIVAKEEEIIRAENVSQRSSPKKGKDIFESPYSFSDASKAEKAIIIGCLIAKIVLLIFVLKVSSYLVFSEYIEIDTAQMGFFFSGFAIAGIAELVRMAPAGNIDRVFGILPTILPIAGAITILLNWTGFVGTFNVFIYTLITYFILSGAAIYNNTVYLVRFQKKKLKKRMSEMTDEEIEGLKEFAFDSSEIDDLEKDIRGDN